MEKREFHLETKAIRTQIKRSEEREHSAPIYMTSSFVFEDAEQAQALFADEISGNIYSRFSNPNTSEFIEKLCQMEGTEDGMATATGMAAMFSSMAALLESGDHVVASRALFGSTHQILTRIFPKWGITSTYAELNDPESWLKAIQPNTKVLFVETPSNPGLELADLRFLSEIAHQNGALLIVDNCFATPYIQQPALLGADLVTHSATKFIDGQGRSLGGAVLGNKALIAKVRFFNRQTGPALSPFNAWMLSKSLETLPVRMERHCENAFQLAKALDGHKSLNWVRYPFLPSHPQYALAKRQMKCGGAIVTLGVKGGIRGAQQFLNQLKMLSLTANLGDTRTTVTHPATTTHSKLSEEEKAAVNITPGLIRISVGLENVQDILYDIEQALEVVKQEEVTVP